MLLREELHRHVVGDVDMLMVQEHKLGQPFGHLMLGGAVGSMSRSGGV